MVNLCGDFGACAEDATLLALVAILLVKQLPLKLTFGWSFVNLWRCYGSHCSSTAICAPLRGAFTNQGCRRRSAPLAGACVRAKQHGSTGLPHEYWSTPLCISALCSNSKVPEGPTLGPRCTS